MKQTLIESARMPIIGSGVPRSEGLHVTDIIRDIEERFTRRPTPAGGEWDLELAGELGFMFERQMEAEIDAVRPGEVELDGISMSPDGIEEIDGDTRLVEYKVTWRSIKKDPTETPKWLMQTKAYCHALGLDTAVFHILYLCGNWKPPSPIYRQYIIWYTQQELQENWDMLVNHARSKEWL